MAPARELANGELGKGLRPRDKERTLIRHLKASPLRRGRRFGLVCLFVLSLWAFVGGDVATAAAEGCPNEAIRQVQHSTYLPDCRAYELVTPPFKPAEFYSTINGLAVGTTTDGNHLFYRSENPLLPGGSEFPTVFRGDRSSDGWSSSTVNPEDSQFGGIRLEAFSDDLHVVVGTGRSYDPTDTNEMGTDIYGFDSERNATLMSPNLATAESTESGAVGIEAATADAQGVVIRTSTALLPGETSGGERLYEYRDGTLSRVDVDNAGNPLWGEGGGISSLGSFFGHSLNAYSRSGSRIYFSTNDSAGLRLWLRTNGTTLPVPPASAGTNEGALFEGATPDGRYAYFTTEAQLVASDTDTSADLYRYDAETEEVTRLSGGAASANMTSDYWVWPSDDGSRVYFVANGQLIAGKGSVSGPNTYLSENGVLRFVAGTALPPRGVFFADGQCQPERVSPDGRFLLVETTAALTPDDTDGEAKDIYLYDAEGGVWTRVSKGSAEDNGPNDALIEAAPVPGATACDSFFHHATRPLSDDGRHVFFETKERLVQGDANGQWDVYEWNSGSGKLSLISNGQSEDQSDFLDATPDGKTVFFTTRSRLTGKDTDAQVDIYSARAGGGFAEPAGALDCQESECQGPPQAQGSAVDPATASLSTPHHRPAQISHLQVDRLSPAALRRLMRTGTLRLHVRAAKKGRIAIALRIRWEHGWANGARVVRRVGDSGWMTVTLRLDHRERLLLGRYRRLLISVHEPGTKGVVDHYAIAGGKGKQR